MVKSENVMLLRHKILYCYIEMNVGAKRKIDIVNIIRTIHFFSRFCSFETFWWIETKKLIYSNEINNDWFSEWIMYFCQ